MSISPRQKRKLFKAYQQGRMSRLWVGLQETAVLLAMVGLLFGGFEVVHRLLFGGW